MQDFWSDNCVVFMPVTRDLVNMVVPCLNLFVTISHFRCCRTPIRARPTGFTGCPSPV
jgi:hypothetical protein